MTMVAACTFKDGAVIISDSRVSWKHAGKDRASDNLQKIVPIGKNMALSYAGSVYLAEKIIGHIRSQASKKEKYRHLRKIAFELPRLARHYCQQYSDYAKQHGLALILAGVEKSGKIYAYRYECPHFQPKDITNDFAVIGSGNVVAPYLEENYEEISKANVPLKQKADKLNRGLDQALGDYQAQYVGGLLQTIMISSLGIQPLNHYSMKLDPEGSSDFLGITMEKGRWVQEQGGSKSRFMEPVDLKNAILKEKKVYEYVQRTRPSDLKYYLSYFFVCAIAKRTVGDMKFEGLIAQIGSHRYPRDLPIVASVGFWGPAGAKELEFRLDDGNETAVVSRQAIGKWVFPERVELDTVLKISIKKPGPVFLNCYVDGFFLGRKALFFSDLTKVDSPKSPEEAKRHYASLAETMPAEHRKFIDPMIEQENVFLEYFLLCEKVEASDGGGTFEVKREHIAFYWKNYPLNCKVTIANSFRLKPGEHLLEVKLKYAKTGEEHLIGKCEIENDSSCIGVPTLAEDLLLHIPKEGIYYLNAYIDGKFVSSILFYAETDKPQFSYELYPEHLDKIRAGEFFSLMVRSQQK